MRCTLSRRIISASDRPEFGGAHGAGEANHHAAAGVEMRAVGLRGVHERRGVEMPEVMLNEMGNRPAGGLGLCFLIHRWSLKISALPHDTKVCVIANPQIQWLYRTTYFTAAKTLRTETRRHKREQEVAKMNQDNLYADTIWESLSPMLNESLNQLDEKDRLVILLRFFQHKPMQEVGETMGISEAAAKMRVSRAIEELREFFSKRNVICSGGVLSAMLTEKAIEAAPVTLMQNVLTAVSSSATASTIIVSVFGKVLVAGGAVVAVALGIGIYVHTVELTASRRSQVFNSYAATGVGNQPGSSSQSAAFAVLNSAANFVDNPKLDKAIADLRAALHSRPKSHDLYDVGLITNAIQEFGNNQQDQRVAFGVLQETVGDSERFVRAGSIFGIGYLGKSLPEASPFLWNLLYSASASDPWNKFEALRKIGFRIWDMPQLTGQCPAFQFCKDSASKFASTPANGIMELSAAPPNPAGRARARPEHHHEIWRR